MRLAWSDFGSDSVEVSWLWVSAEVVESVEVECVSSLAFIVETVELKKIKDFNLKAQQNENIC